MKKLLLLVFTCLFVMKGFSQYKISMAPPTNGQSKDFVPASPNASSLGIYGQVPVGNYTGVAAAGVPLYTLKYKELEVPISLSYHSASGIKPDNYPGTVGLGFVLNSGGSITRVVRGVPDYEKITTPSTTVPVLNNPTAVDHWSLDSMMNRYRRFGIYTPNDTCAPDEYYFNFVGIAGKFYINHDGKFKVQSDKGTFLTVEHEILEGKQFVMPKLPQIPDLRRTITPDSIFGKPLMLYSFTLTDERGIKYKFGGSDSAIEFSRPGHSFSGLDTAMMMHYVVPMTWNLISIESPNHYKIVFNYKRGVTVTKIGYNEVQNFVWESSTNSQPAPGTQPQNVDYEKSTLMNVSYLTSIVTPKDSISFITSPAAQQLRYRRDSVLDQMASILSIYNPSPGIYQVVNENHFIWYKDINYAYTQDLIPEKLDQIVIADKNSNIFKSFQFEYTNDLTKRLKLLSVKTGSQQYKFEYNPLSLPGYVSYQTDHYGYYNGRSPYKPRRVNINADSLYQSKEVDTAYVQAEILRKIIYPTGGYTEFEYEPNTYSSKVNTWPFTVTANTVNAITGGVRIKKITSYDAPGKVASTKRYAYVKNYASGGQLSSGVLAFAPSYYESYDNKVVTPPLQFSFSPTAGNYNGTLDLRRWSTNALFPMSATRGNPVTYSEVTEINADNSFVVYKYKNYDNGYHDKPPVNYTSDNIEVKQFWQEEEGSSLNIERGQLLSEEYYNAAVTKVKKTEYKYNDDTARFKQHIRTLLISRNNMPFTSYRVTASLIYTYFPYLKRVISSDYYNADSITTTEDYVYDSTYRVLKQQTTTNSSGERQKVVHVYAKDRVTAGQTIPYDTMVKRGMVGLPVETLQYNGDTLLSKQSTAYVKGVAQDTSLILPASFSVQYKNRAAEVRAHNHLYSRKGNLLCESKEKGVKTCYVWSYANSFVIAKIVGAEYATVEAALGGRTVVEAWADMMPANNTDVKNFVQLLREAPSLGNAFITTYTYHPQAGMASETDPNGKSIYYDYDQSGRLTLVRDHNNYILKKICYDYAGKPADCDTVRMLSKYEVLGRASSKLVICGGNPLLINFVPAYKSTLFNLETYDPGPIDPADSLDLIEADTLLPKGYFKDAALTDPLEDGYYKLNGIVIGGEIYFRIHRRKILYVNPCNGSEPLLYTYTKSLPFPTFMCDNDTLPVVAVFPDGAIFQNTPLYSNYQLTKPVKDGYYEKDGQVLKVVNGIIDSIGSCAPPIPVTTLYAGWASSPFGICSAFVLNLPYYYQAATFTPGVVLYSNATLTSFAAQGVYKMGTRYFTIGNAGIVLQIFNCF